MQEIQGQAKTVNQLLSNSKYAIDYYQRDYKWETKQIQELVEDLCGRFLDEYQPNHQREEVATMVATSWAQSSSAKKRIRISSLTGSNV